MPLKKIAERLSIACENDEQLADTIVASFEQKDSVIAAKDAEIAELKKKVPTDPLTVTAAHRSMLRDNRSMKLLKLVEEEHISPAVKDDLLSLFCTDEALTLSLAYENSTDVFDTIIAALGKNTIVSLGEAERQPLGKDGVGGTKRNELLEDAKRRKEAGKN